MPSLDLLGDLSRDREHAFDGLAIGIRAVRREREPQRQTARAPGQVMCVIARVPVRSDVQRVQVRRLLPVGGPRHRGIPVEERTRVERREQPLVRVDDERICPVDAAEPVPDGRGQERRAAVGSVDVEPDAAFPAHVGHRREIVDHAGVRGARARDDREKPVRSGVVERPGQAVARQPAALVVRNLDQIHVHHGRRRGHRGVRGVGGRHLPPGGPGGATRGGATRGGVMPGGDERRQVPGGPA